MGPGRLGRCDRSGTIESYANLDLPGEGQLLVFVEIGGSRLTINRVFQSDFARLVSVRCAAGFAECGHRMASGSPTEKEHSTPLQGMPIEGLCLLTSPPLHVPSRPLPLNIRRRRAQASRRSLAKSVRDSRRLEQSGSSSSPRP